MQYVKVLINKKIQSLDHDFLYEVPPELYGVVDIGSAVAVPFGRRTEKGIVIGFTDDPGDIRPKFIDDICNDGFFFPEDLLFLADRLGKYYMSTTMGFIRAMVPRGVNLFGKIQKEKTEKVLVTVPHAGDICALRGKKQRELAAVLKEAERLTLSEAAKQGFSAEVCRGLVKNGFARMEVQNVRRYSYRNMEKNDENIPELTLEQQQALSIIRNRDENDHRPVLIHGVTGSGKTELYMRLIADTLAKGKQAIVLLPEIALTPQFVRIFERRFHGNIVLFHSRLSEGERRDAWFAFRRGEAGIALGARSCIFAPGKDLGLIIIDEEHEDSYEQDSAPRFHARKAALLRGEITGALVVFGSATPSFESYREAMEGRYLYVSLHQRVGGTPLPEIVTVDMRRELKEGWTEVLSRLLIKKMECVLAEKKQVMLFLNRLGYHTFISCRDCGFVYRCPDCDVPLTYYKEERTLRCTRCNYSHDPEEYCPQCHSKRIKYFGLGIEQLEEIVRHHFPFAEIDRLDSDRIRYKNSVDNVFEKMYSGKTQILIGTRMIAKGWDFPNVALMGIIAADYTLNFPDFRSGEKTFQLISQVAGRCGRSLEQGTVILQTYRPEEPTISYGALQDFDGFYRWEADKRRKYGYPPFAHLMKVIIVTPRGYLRADEPQKIRAVFEDNENEDGIRIFGPSPGIYRDKGKDKWVLSFLCDKVFPIRERINKGILRLKSEKIINKNISIQIETEPIHSV